MSVISVECADAMAVEAMKMEGRNAFLNCQQWFIILVVHRMHKQVIWSSKVEWKLVGLRELYFIPWEDFIEFITGWVFHAELRIKMVAAYMS